MFGERRENDPHRDGIFGEENCHSLTSREVLFAVKVNNRLCSENKQSDDVKLQGGGPEHRYKDIFKGSGFVDDAEHEPIRKGLEDSGKNQGADIQQPRMHLQEEEEVRNCFKKRELRVINRVSSAKRANARIKVRHHPDLPEQSGDPERNEQALKGDLIDHEEPEIHIKDIKISHQADHLGLKQPEPVAKKASVIKAVLRVVHEDDYQL